MGEQPQEEPPLDVYKLHSELAIAAFSSAETVLLRLMRGSEQGAVPVADYVASWPLLENEENMHAWIKRTKELFSSAVKSLVLNEIALMFAASAGTALIEAGLAPYDKKGLLDSNLSIYEQLMREWLGIDAGRPAKWTAQELSQVILDVMCDLSDGRRTYNQVAKVLRDKYPERAPKSGESLRKTVERLGIDWMKIKRMAEKRKRS